MPLDSRSPQTMPRLSQHIAHVLLTKSPRHAWHEHRDLGGQESDPTAATDNGNLIHEVVLGGNKIKVLDFPDWKTKHSREIRDVWRSNGKIPVLRKHYAAAMPAVESLRRELDLQLGIDLSDWTCEQRIEWEQDGVLCEGTPDAVLLADRLRVIDLKTTGKTAPRRIAPEGWALQRHAYLSGLTTLHPSYAGRHEWFWVVLETKPPYGVSIAEADGTLDELGRREWSRALRMWKILTESLDVECWPGYGRTVLEAPAWALAQWEYQDE